MKNIRRFLHRYFIPHKGNNHKPHLLRQEKAVVIFALLFLVEATFLSYVFGFIPQGFFGADVVSAVLRDLANSERAVSGTHLLALNPLLSKAAQMKADDMAARSYFSHNDPAGKEPWHWLEEAGYSYSYAGENLAINYFDSLDVQKAWMESTEHRANILKKNYTDMGIGVAHGTFESKPAVFIVQFFGAQAPQEKVKVAIAPRAGVPQKTQVPVARFDASGTPSVQAAAIFKPDHLLASPRQTVAHAYELIASVVAIAVGILFAYKKHLMNPDLLRNGALLGLFIALLLAGNWYLSAGNGMLASAAVVGGI